MDTRGEAQPQCRRLRVPAAACVQAAHELGVASLRELTVADLPRAQVTLSSDLVFRRARHVVIENARVRTVVDLFAIGRGRHIGTVLTAAPRSMRDDFEASDPAVDLGVIGPRGGRTEIERTVVKGELYPPTPRQARASSRSGPAHNGAGRDGKK